MENGDPCVGVPCKFLVLLPFPTFDNAECRCQYYQSLNIIYEKNFQISAVCVISIESAERVTKLLLVASFEKMWFPL